MTRINIIVTMAAAALGLAAAVFGNMVVDPKLLSDVFLAAVIALIHFSLYQTRRILAAEASEKPFVRRQFKKGKTDQLVSVAGSCIGCLVTILAGAYLGSIRNYVIVMGIAYFLAMLANLATRLGLLNNSTDRLLSMNAISGRHALTNGVAASLILILLFRPDSGIWIVVTWILILVFDVWFTSEFFFGDEQSIDVPYSVEKGDSVEFYEEIAPVYDGETYKINETYKWLRKAIVDVASDRRQSSLTILDVGGGTGALPEGLSQYPHLEWVIYDASQRMLDRVDSKFVDMNLHPKKIHGKLDRLDDHLVHNSYDIIIFCFSLSSMASPLDFNVLHGHLTQGGVVLIADADREHSSHRPIFDVKKDGRCHGLKIAPPDLALLLEQATESHFKITKVKRLKNDYPGRKGNDYYSFGIELSKL